MLGAAFVLACGFGHWLDSRMFDWPGYRALGVWHAVTALVSAAMLVAWRRFRTFVIHAPDPDQVRLEVEAAGRPFRLGFENSPSPGAQVDAEGNVVRANRAMAVMLGTTVVDLEGRNFADFTTGPTLQQDLDLFAQLIDGRRERYNLEKSYNRFDTGTEVFVHLSVICLERGADGRMTLCLAQLVDLTHQRSETARADAEVRKALEAARLADVRAEEIRKLHERLIERGLIEAEARLDPSAATPREGGDDAGA